MKPPRKRGHAYFEARLEAAWEAYGKMVNKVADEAREQYVVPYCDRTGKAFRAGGMGDWCFGNDELNTAPKHIEAVLTLIPVGMETTYFGVCMENYTPKKDGDG